MVATADNPLNLFQSKLITSFCDQDWCTHVCVCVHMRTNEWDSARREKIQRSLPHLHFLLTTLLVFLPSRGVSVFIKINLLSRDSSEGRFQQVVQQLAAIDRVHGLAEPRLSWAQLLVHIMEAVSHGIDGIDDKAHFTILNIVFMKTLISCWKGGGGGEKQGIKRMKTCRKLFCLSGVFVC